MAHRLGEWDGLNSKNIFIIHNIITRFTTPNYFSRILCQTRDRESKNIIRCIQNCNQLEIKLLEMEDFHFSQVIQG